jgi:tetratricopeptide (TPR) repeat protein
VSRGPDNRSGGPPARRGPRDPLIDEIRASTPKAKQEAAIAAFEHARELLQRGRDGGAAEAAAEAKRLAPRSGAVRELYGVALYRTGRYRDALRELQAYRRMTGRLDQNHLMADSYRGLGMPDKAVPVAVEAVRSRLREEPRAEAAIVGASALADLGRYDEALGLLRGFPGRRDEADPWELRVWYVAGDVLQRAGRPSEAAEEFRRVVRYDAGAFDAAERLAALTT